MWFFTVFTILLFTVCNNCQMMSSLFMKFGEQEKKSFSRSTAHLPHLFANGRQQYSVSYLQSLICLKPRRDFFQRKIVNNRVTQLFLRHGGVFELVAVRYRWGERIILSEFEGSWCLTVAYLTGHEIKNNIFLYSIQNYFYKIKEECKFSWFFFLTFENCFINAVFAFRMKMYLWLWVFTYNTCIFGKPSIAKSNEHCYGVDLCIRSQDIKLPLAFKSMD